MAKKNVTRPQRTPKILMFEDYARMWLKAYKSPPKIRPGSYEVIRNNLELHVIPFFVGMTLEEVTAMDLQEYLNTISMYSNSLQAKCCQIVKAIFRTALTNRKIQYSPVDPDAFKPCGGRPEEEVPLTPEQSQQLLDAVRGTRAYTFCLLALSTGMRRGEILGLMWEDVKLDDEIPHIHVLHNKAFPAHAADAPVTSLLKTPAACRMIPLPPPLVNHLREMKATSKSDFVLCMEDGRSLNRNAFRSLWTLVTNRTEGGDRRIGKSHQGRKTGMVQLDFHCHPHQLRHTYATRLFENGCDVKQVQYLLGHSKPEMTMRIYVHYQASIRHQQTAEQVCMALGGLA